MKDAGRQTGFTIVTALMVVVILALVGTYMVSISALTRASGNLSLQGVRAYYAARSGLEWGIYRVAPSAASGGAPPYNCPTSPTTLTFTQGGLNGFTATVTCTASSFTESGQSYNIFQVTSTAQYSTLASPDYVSRQLYVTVVQPGV